MAQKRKPNISQKPLGSETQKTAPVVVPKAEATKSYIKSKPVKEKGIGLLFGPINYLLMLGGLLLIIIGFFVMSGGGSTDPKVFNGDELFSAQRLTVAPIMILLGFAVEVVAIMLKPKQKAEA
jgi:hypothetical protein